MYGFMYMQCMLRTDTSTLFMIELNWKWSFKHIITYHVYDVINRQWKLEKPKNRSDIGFKTDDRRSILCTRNYPGSTYNRCFFEYYVNKIVKNILYNLFLSPFLYTLL